MGVDLKTIEQLAPIVGPIAAVLIVLGVPLVIYLLIDSKRMRKESRDDARKNAEYVAGLHKESIELQRVTIEALDNNTKALENTGEAVKNNNRLVSDVFLVLTTRKK